VTMFISSRRPATLLHWSDSKAV